MSLTTDDGKPCEGLEQGPFEPIAVIGLAAMMPDAEDLQSFWQNIIDSHVSIKEIREGRWPGPVDHFWMEGTCDVAHGYTYAKIGAFIEGYEFDWRRWRQPPGTIPQIDSCQLWAVSVSAAAIEQAAQEGEKEFPENEQGLSLRMHLVAKIETCQTSGCGPIISQNLPSHMACRPRSKKHSWTP